MATTDLSQAFHGNLSFLLEETFASPQRPGGSAYLDQRTGWYPTLESISAEQASTSLVPGGTTIAGHVDHARFHLETSLRYMAGSDERVDWAESWRVREVDEAAWAEVRSAFVETAERVQRSLLELTSWSDREVGGAFAVIAHCAYHLGAVRQILQVTR